MTHQLFARRTAEELRRKALNDPAHVGLLLFLFFGCKAIDKDTLIAVGVEFPGAIGSDPRQSKAVHANPGGATPFAFIARLDGKLEAMLTFRELEFFDKATSQRLV